MPLPFPAFHTEQTAPVAAVLDQLVARASGLVVVAGPTGHGKTVFADVLLERLNHARRSRNVFVGDIRNSQTLRTATELAHDLVVLGVLRIAGSYGALDRLSDMDGWSAGPWPCARTAALRSHHRCGSSIAEDTPRG